MWDVFDNLTIPIKRLGVWPTLAVGIVGWTIGFITLLIYNYGSYVVEKIKYEIQVWRSE